ncbi:MAG: NAD-dependent epimerase/dehydratase family protein [Phycisphaerae bacterium]|nr:NAD-dependent epimerase/dehydratase family protein [Phycisphaerae bacterium]
MATPSAPSRRDFLRTVAVASAAASIPALAGKVRAISPRFSGGGKRILILGGTGFLGPETVEVALARGHHVTIFNRGRTEERKGPMFAGKEVERLVGDRDPTKGEGLKSLEGKKFDAVVDNSGYVPRIVSASAELLAPNAGHYLFISSVSVYKDNSRAGDDETAAVGTMTDETVEEMGAQFENYGPLKALCEKAAEKAMPGRTTAVRPGLIVGPNDPTDRFTYWPVRVDRGGEVLCPGSPEDPIQVIDVRDLAEWVVMLIESKTTGTYDALGPQSGLTIGKLITACQAASGKPSTLTWADAEFLEQQRVSPWSEMPVWLPAVGEMSGMHRRNVSRAVAAGLKFRDISHTVKDTLTWWPKELERRIRVTAEIKAKAKAEGKPEPAMANPNELRAGITASREKDVLAAWAARPKNG